MQPASARLSGFLSQLQLLICNRGAESDPPAQEAAGTVSPSQSSPAWRAGRLRALGPRSTPTNGTPGKPLPLPAPRLSTWAQKAAPRSASCMRRKREHAGGCCLHGPGPEEGPRGAAELPAPRSPDLPRACQEMGSAGKREASPGLGACGGEAQGLTPLLADDRRDPEAVRGVLAPTPPVAMPTLVGRRVRRGGGYKGAQGAGRLGSAQAGL